MNLLYPEGEGEDKLKRKVQLVYSLIHFNRLSFEEIDFSSGRNIVQHEGFDKVSISSTHKVLGRRGTEQFRSQVV